MQFLANENFPLDVVQARREQGHDVAWIRADSPGVDDKTVLERAVVESRIVLTFDKDFGELAFRSRLPASSGVVLFRFAPRTPEFTVRRILTTIASRQDWAGHFAVVDEFQIRKRRLPLHHESRVATLLFLSVQRASLKHIV